MANATAVLWPAVTEIVLGLSPTVQLGATPFSWTEWEPGEMLPTERLPLRLIGWPLPPSTLRVYPSGSSEVPVVAAVIWMLPVPAGGVTQEIANLIGTDPPVGTVACLGLVPATVQLAATPVSSTECRAAVTPGKESEAFTPSGWAAPASMLTL